MRFNRNHATESIDDEDRKNTLLSKKEAHTISEGIKATTNTNYIHTAVG